MPKFAPIDGKETRSTPEDDEGSKLADLKIEQLSWNPQLKQGVLKKILVSSEDLKLLPIECSFPRPKYSLQSNRSSTLNRLLCR